MTIRKFAYSLAIAMLSYRH